MQAVERKQAQPRAHLVAGGCLELDLEHCVGEPADLVVGNVGEGVVHPDVLAVPVAVGAVQLAHHRELSVQGDAHLCGACVSGVRFSMSLKRHLQHVEVGECG